MRLIDACPQCDSISNIVSDSKFKMKYKCNWCGFRFTTPKKAPMPGPDRDEREYSPGEKEAYWFDETED